MAKCPACGEQIHSMNGESVTLFVGLNQWNGIVYSCQSCDAALSVGVDIIAVKTDIVDEISDILQQALQK